LVPGDLFRLEAVMRGLAGFLTRFGYRLDSSPLPGSDIPPAHDGPPSASDSAINCSEVRAEDISWSAIRGGIDLGSVIVNPRLAENLSTVLACISAISSAMASLPAYVYRTEGKARTIDENHPVARLIANGPNDFQT